MKSLKSILPTTAATTMVAAFKKTIPLSASVLAICCISNSAFAAVVTQTYKVEDFSNQLTLTDIGQTISLATFDDDDGNRTLTGVKLVLTADYQTEFDVTNNSGTTQSFEVADSTKLYLNQSNGTQLLAYHLTTGENNSILEFNEALTVTGLADGQTYNSGVIANSKSEEYNFTTDVNKFLADQTAYNLVGDFNSFTGSNPLVFNGLTKISYTLSGAGGNFTVEQMTSAKFSGYIEYTYETTAVPEPHSIALLAFGLCGLAVVRRRRTTNSYN